MLKRLSVLLVVLALVVAACGDDDAATTTTVAGTQATTTTAAPATTGGNGGQSGDGILATVQARGVLKCGVSGAATAFSHVSPPADSGSANAYGKTPRTCPRAAIATPAPTPTRAMVSIGLEPLRLGPTCLQPFLVFPNNTTAQR